ncbi:MAG: hypothetical protein OER82_00010 [Nitrosopumilus sp.]|nr:hypothetical protein [Nitrosopumilus sp.]
MSSKEIVDSGGGISSVSSVFYFIIFIEKNKINKINKAIQNVRSYGAFVPGKWEKGVAS